MGGAAYVLNGPNLNLLGILLRPALWVAEIVSFPIKTELVLRHFLSMEGDAQAWSSHREQAEQPA